MLKRALGSQGLSVSALGLGCMSMSGVYGAADEDESIATVRRALDLGVTLFDTAEVYGGGHNERLLGLALKGRRHEAVISTKFGFDIQDGKTVGVNSRPDNLRRAVDQSLTRLGVDHIDLLFQHRVDPAVPIEDVAGAVGDLVEAGKVRYFGLSEAGIETLTRAHAVHPVSALQSEYSLWERNLEPEILPALRRLGIGLVAFSPLGRGFLTGTVDAAGLGTTDLRQTDPRFQADNFDANLQAVSIVRSIAATRSVEPGQIALAWLLGRGDDIVPIPGTKRRRYLEANLAAASLVLDASERASLDAALAAGTVSGPRYNERQASLLDR